MYTTARCPYCLMAEQLLVRKGVTSICKMRVDLEPDKFQEMIAKTGRRTVPQIFIGGFHIGGFQELAALDREGRLDELLQ
ncbi:MAG: glutaredoxin 3 [Methylohalobius sp.]|nr:glutaredoxin 3 [Methylohalobius sp.]